MTRRSTKYCFIRFYQLNQFYLPIQLSSLCSRIGKAGPRSILLFIFFSSILFSQTIRKIEIAGAKNFAVSEYKKWSGISEGSKSFTGIEDTIATRIQYELRREGYYHCLISMGTEKIDSSSIKIWLEINENNPTIINSIKVVTSIPDSLKIVSFLNDLKGNIFSTNATETKFEEIFTYYENHGYPFTKIKISSVIFSADSTNATYTADIYLDFETGNKQTIDQIVIEGNFKTKENVIIRSARVALGSTYNQIILDEIPNRLNRLRFFEPVEPPMFYTNSKEKGVLKILVKEKETNSFDGIAGYVPSSNQNESGYFTGFVNMSMRNLFGTGRSALFRWQQENRSSQELEIRYLEPWLLGFPLNVEVGLFQRKQDSTYVQRNIEAKIEYLATEDISASLFLNSQSTIPSEREFNSFTVYNSNAFSTGFIFKYDTRDDYYSPTSGMLFVSTYKFTRKNINGPEQFISPLTQTEYNQQRIEFDFSVYKQLFNRQIAAFGLHGRELRGSNLEVSDLYLFGGSSTLRGYREKQFLGNRIFWSNMEYRYLLSRRTFAFLFFDTGYYLRTESSPVDALEYSDFRYGYGFGMNIETGLGVLSVSFALGKGDSFTDGKIHFGIINEF